MWGVTQSNCDAMRYEIIAHMNRMQFAAAEHVVKAKLSQFSDESSNKSRIDMLHAHSVNGVESSQ